MYSGNIARFRGIQLADVEPLLAYLNEYETRRFLGSVLPNSKEEELEWVRNRWKAQSNGKIFTFAVESKETGGFVGICDIWPHSMSPHTGEIGIALNPALRNKGFGTETMKFLLWFGFNMRNYQRIELEVIEGNDPAKHVYEKVGFKEVGRHRNYIFRNGKYLDTILMDILREEWKPWYPLELQ